MSNAADVRQLAEKCRALARQTLDAKTRDALSQLAEEYDSQADKASITAEPGKAAD